MTQSISQLLHQCQRGFTDYCPYSIAACYRLACAIADGDGVNVYTSYDDFLNKFANNCQQLKQQNLKEVDY